MLVGPRSNDQLVGQSHLEVPPASRAPAGPRRVVSGISWSMLGLVVAALAQWVVIVLISRLGTTEMVGQYALGLAVGAPVILLGSMALRTVQVTDVGGNFDFADYLRLRVFAMLVALVVIAVVAALLGSTYAAVVMLVGLAKALDAIGDIFFGLFQRHELMRPIGMSMVLNGLLTVIAAGLLLLATGSIGWALVGSVLGSLTASVGYCAWAAKRLSANEPAVASRADVRPRHGSPPRPEGSMVRRMGRLAAAAAPLGLASGLVSLSANLPRYVIEHTLGAVDLGIFAALSYIVLVTNIFFAAISQLLLPRLTRLSAAGEFDVFSALILRLVLGTLAGGCVVVAGVVAVGPAAARFVYGAPYGEHGDVLGLLSVAAVLSGTVFFLGVALSALRKFGNQLTASLVMVVAAAVAGILLIPRFGLVGAAWSVVVTIGCDCVLKALMLNRALTRRLWT